MKKGLIIGAGGVSNVATKKIARLTEVFTDITLASRTKSKCDQIAAEIPEANIKTAQVDADNVEDMIALIKDFFSHLFVFGVRRKFSKTYIRN